MTEKWDQSWRDMDHPDLHKHVLFHLSKAVGKVSLSPAELVKNYITDEKNANQMTAFVLDETQLKNLRKDILDNPEKYQAVVDELNPIDDPYYT
jgi:hypothetical protein